MLQLKDVTRWGFDRDKNDPSESVAEHVFGLMVLAKHFLPIVDSEKQMDRQVIYDMIMWHDTGEIETGDIPTFQKTQKHTDAEVAALKQVKEKSPGHLSHEIYDSALEYESGSSREIQFVKMLDKLEGAFELSRNKEVAKMRYAKQKVTKEMFLNKRAFIADSYPEIFPYVQQMADDMEEYGSFMIL